MIGRENQGSDIRSWVGEKADKIMKKSVVIIIVSLFASVLLLACGGGGSGGGGVESLQGTWLGWIEDDEGTVEEFSLQIDGAGNVIDALIGLSHYGTGHINEGYDENVFHVLDYAGSALGHGIMIVDDQYSHGVYGNYGSTSSDYYCGVLEKEAMGFPSYASTDIVANYPAGGAYEGSAGVWEGDGINMNVDLALDFTGSAPGESFYGSFDSYNSDFGRYAGTLTRDIIPPVIMDITAYISPDGEAIAAFATSISATPDYLEDFLLIGLIQ